MNKYLSALCIGVLIAVLIAASMSIVNASSSQQTVISCMDITTPGYYYLALNITGLQADRERCIGIFTGRRTFYIVGLVFSALGLLLLVLFSNNISLLILAFTIMGYGEAFRLSSLEAWIADECRGGEIVVIYCHEL